MKKLIVGFMTALVALVPLVSAFGLPQPISGRIYTMPEGAAGDLTVIAESLRTGGILYAERSGNEYLVEAANMPGGYAEGDTIRVTIVECADKPACVKEVVGEGHPIELDFDLREIVCLPCPVCSPCDSCCPSCPVCPTTTTTVCPDCEECPVCEFDILTAFISAVANTSGVGVGVTGLVAKEPLARIMRYAI